MNTYRFVKKTYCAQILIECGRFPPFGFDIAEIIRRKTWRLFKKTSCARILIEGARFAPSGFDTAEISSNSNEDVSFGEARFA